MKDKIIKLNEYICSLPPDERNYLLQDLPRWVEITKNNNQNPFIDLWTKRQEFRSVIKYRAKNAPHLLRTRTNYISEINNIIGNTRQLYVNNLYISCNDIGPGLYIEHGFSTIIFAKTIGKNFWINQNVTVGTGNSGNPIIKDNVRLGANSVVIGGITINNNVKLGAGAVLNFEVPEGATVVSQKPRVLLPESHR